ncbi:isochorismatase family protein [Streptomyces polyrhachis]|uniref:Isochorismatase family protein n=1 Tax=Streptomyces polyrhachis TaxID=1282885 RepID=A0ABW2GLB8_9ACTN
MAAADDLFVGFQSEDCGHFRCGGLVAGQREVGVLIDGHGGHHAPALRIPHGNQSARLPRLVRRAGPDHTVETIAGLSPRARAADVPVITVQQQGCGDVLPELAPQDGESVVTKTCADAFLDTGLDETLIRLGVTEVLVTGFATENCVETTARQALSRGYDLVLVVDGHTTSVRPQSTDFAPPDQSIAHHNEIYRHIDFPARSVRALPATGIDFTAPKRDAPER